MLKAVLTSLVVPGIALLIAMPPPAFAESHPRAGSHFKRHSVRPFKHRQQHFRHNRHDRQRDRHNRHRWHKRRHDSHNRHRWHKRRHDGYNRHRGHYRDHRPRHHRRHHRRHGHHGVRIGVNIGGYAHRPPYPHGHAHHIHDVYCPVVIRPVIIAPVWKVYYHSHYRPSASAMLHVVIGSFSGALYIDDQYYGEAHQLRDGRLEIPVSPGLHSVQLRHDGRTYSRDVHAKPGATAVVKANHKM